MSDPQASPISQLLNTLGLTREDLNKRSDEMRQFLTADAANSSRVFDLQGSFIQTSPTPSKPTARLIALPSSIGSPDASAEPSTPERPPSPDTPDMATSQRPMDTMEAVIERQRLARKDKRGKNHKERDTSLRRSASFPPPSASRESSQKPEPEEQPASTSSVLTPQQSRYYRDHTAEQSQVPRTVPKIEAESPVIPKSSSQPSRVSYYQFPAYVMPVPFYSVPFPASMSAPQVTPSKPVPRVIKSSPLPPSSPPEVSSSPPSSSPVKVNLVSSPGPIGPELKEADYSKLPFKLPLGPYSPNKPEISYAAILGQAILSSPEHRLTLQEIYDWITIVYPYFKRGETTWMNSIRHVLSTTACFRKVVRDRSVGRTHWAIWDEDLECFKNGKFRKEFCKDIMANTKSKRTRKQDDDDDGGSRKPKKAKKASSRSDAITLTAASLPLFPPSGSQPKEPVPAEVMFPPVAVHVQSKEESDDLTKKEPDDVAMADESTVEPSHGSQEQRSGSSPSLPDLTPNRSSSSPPPSTSDFDTLSTMSQTEPSLHDAVSISGLDVSEDEDDTFTRSTGLTPVHFWGNALPGSSKPRSPLKSGIKLKATAQASNISDSEDFSSDHGSDDEYNPKGKGKKPHKKRKVIPRNQLSLSALPPSPTPVRRSNKGKTKDVPSSDLKKNNKTLKRSPEPETITVIPVTPPRERRKQLSMSPMTTPLSHKGIHMSPNAGPSLAYYKNNLNPPPPLDFNEDDDPVKTPSRKRTTFEISTPGRKLVFPGSESPFRTPIGLSSSSANFYSPYRGASIFDPNSPGTMLDDELSRLNDKDSSPVGLFPKSRGTLLYDSPNNFTGSPGKYASGHLWPQ